MHDSRFPPPRADSSYRPVPLTFGVAYHGWSFQIRFQAKRTTRAHEKAENLRTYLSGRRHQHSADENAFPYGDWTGPYRSADGRSALTALYGGSFDLLLGRRTYDLWSNYWPQAPSGPMSDPLNAATKYVATHRPESLQWGPYEAVGADLVEGVQRLKSQDGANLILWGSSTLTSPLLAADLVDEVVLFLYPVLLGTGKRFFADGTAPRSLEPVSTTTTPSGVTLMILRPSGGLKAT